MRKTTRSKYYGRTEVAGILSGMSLNIDQIIKSCEHHKLGGKRLIIKAKKIQTAIQELHKEVVAMPVTQDEKFLAKVKRKKEAAA